MSATLLDLPLEVLTNILIYLSLKDLRNVMLTNKTLNDCIKSDKTLWRIKFKDELVINCNKLLENNVWLFPFSYYNLCRISSNWSHGIYKHKIVIQHKVNYMPWLQYYNSEYLLLSTGSSLRCQVVEKNGQRVKPLWQIDVPTIMRNDIRTNDISRFLFKSDILTCGNRDGCTAVYKLDNIKQKPRLLQHIQNCHENGQLEVSSVEALIKTSSPCIITATGRSPHLKFWKWYDNNDESWLNKSHVIRDIKIWDNVGLRCLSINEPEEKLAIGVNGNDMPGILDIETGAFQIDASCSEKKAVRDVQWHDANTVTYVTHSGYLESIDIRTNSVIYKALDPFDCSLYCVKTDGNNAIVVGSSQYSRCVLFDTRNPMHHVQMYFTTNRSSPIYSLDFDITKLIAATDRTVAILNFNVSRSSVDVRDYSHTFEVVRR